MPSQCLAPQTSDVFQPVPCEGRTIVVSSMLNFVDSLLGSVPTGRNLAVLKLRV